MIVITGAAGFIGSCLLTKLNNVGYKDIVLVDNFSNGSKNINIVGKSYSALVDRFEFFSWLNNNHEEVEFVFHIGARTDTTEFCVEVFDKLNLNYSKEMWQSCAKFGIPLVYASSAATYGMGENGYEDNHDIIPSLKPLNPYGESKNNFDIWALQQTENPPFWAGLKFFNVYGPNEYHKGRMASVVYHAYHQIEETGGMKLFRSHNPAFEDGKQLRDFVYVKDVVKVCLFFLLNQKHSGIYNLGTGEARSFLDLVTNVFQSMRLQPKIEFVDTPLDIRDKYQYFTEAKMDKLRAAGYEIPFCSIEEGVSEYVENYLIEKKYF
jgi:ADP-L-glycero-D-manno-heptose 6-epimerase